MRIVLCLLVTSTALAGCLDAQDTRGDISTKEIEWGKYDFSYSPMAEGFEFTLERQEGGVLTVKAEERSVRGNSYSCFDRGTFTFDVSKNDMGQIRGSDDWTAEAKYFYQSDLECGYPNQFGTCNYNYYGTYETSTRIYTGFDGHKPGQ